MNVRPAVCNAYECSTRQLMLKTFVIPSDIRFEELGNSTPFMRLSFIVFFSARVEVPDNLQSGAPVQKCNLSTSYVIRTFLTAQRETA